MKYKSSGLMILLGLIITGTVIVDSALGITPRIYKEEHPHSGTLSAYGGQYTSPTYDYGTRWETWLEEADPYCSLRIGWVEGEIFTWKSKYPGQCYGTNGSGSMKGRWRNEHGYSVWFRGAVDCYFGK